MTTRFTEAVVSVSDGTTSIATLARRLSDAINEAQGDGANPTDDPAVLLLGGLMEFHLNTIGRHSYRELVHACEEKRPIIHH